MWALFGRQTAHIAQQQGWNASATVTRVHVNSLAFGHGRDAVRYHSATLLISQCDEVQQRVLRGARDAHKLADLFVQQSQPKFLHRRCAGLLQYIHQRTMYPADQWFACDGFECSTAIGGAKVVGGHNHIVLLGCSDQRVPLCLLPRQRSDLPALRTEGIGQGARHGVHAAPGGLF